VRRCEAEKVGHSVVVAGNGRETIDALEHYARPSASHVAS